MQEQHRLAMRADLRLAGAEHPCALRLQPVAGGEDVVHLVADVMDAALREAGHGLPVIYLSPRGKPFTQARARALANGPGMTLICGRFEGVDQRVLDAHAVEEISIGDYVLTGGELAAQVLIDATVRTKLAPERLRFVCSTRATTVPSRSATAT